MEPKGEAREATSTRGAVIGPAAPAATAAELGRERAPVGRQLWRDLLFLHQPLPARLLRPLVPSPLAIDTFDGSAWATLIPLAIFASRPAGAPRALAIDFLEVNLRTY